MAINFPDSPTDGQTYINTVTGQEWTYELATNSWTASSLAVTGGVIYKGSVDITAAPPTGAKAGEQWSVGTGGTANAGYGPGVTGTITKGSVVMYTGTDWLEASHTVPDATPAVKGIDTRKWTRTGTVLSPATAGDVVSAGLVGIGNSSPRGNIHVGADIAGGATDAAAINIKQTSTTKDAGIYLERSGDRRGHYIYISSANDALTFERNNNGTSAVSMVLDRVGDVKIGPAPATPKISLKADGSGTFAGAVSAVGVISDRTGIGMTAFSSRLNGKETVDIKADGNVLIGGTLPASPNIQLKADGSAQFGGDSNSGLTGVRILKEGIITICRAAAEQVFSTKAAGSSAITSVFTGDGTLRIGGTLPTLPKITLKPDGSATFAGNIISSSWPTTGYSLENDAKGGSLGLTSTAANTGNVLAITKAGSQVYAITADGNVDIGGTLPGSPNISLKANGSAKFAGTAEFANPGSLNKVLIYHGAPTGSGNVTHNIQNSVRTGDPKAPIFGSYDLNTTEHVFRISNDASAYFLGTVGIGGDCRRVGPARTEAPNITLNDSGAATFKGAVTATVTPPSDARFKENITPANPQLADVVALGKQLKNFDWNDEAPLNDELRSVRQLGLIAQEAEMVSPGIVKTIKRTKQGKELTPEKVIPAVYKEVVDPEDEENFLQELVTPEQIIPATYEEVDDSFKGISHDALIMKLLGAVAELSAEVEALKAAK